MSMTFTAEPVPLAANSDGVILVGGTRVTLDTVVEAFREGYSAEEIVEQYPSLDLGDIYTVLGFLLRHEAEINHYLSQRAERATVVREENERRFPPHGLRAKLLSRRRQE